MDVAATFDIKANDKTKEAFASVSKKLNKLASVAGKATIALAAVSGTALTGLAISSARSADALAKQADKIGITTEKLAALHYMTEQYTNAGVGAMSEALTKAEKRLGEFVRTGGGAAATWLKSLNLDVEHLKSLSPDKLFETYAEAIQGLNTRGEQLAATSALMGDESRALINIIDATPDSFRNAEKEAKAFGLTLSRIEIAKIEAAGDAIDKVQQVFKGVGNKLAVKFSVYIEEIANRFNDAAISSNGFVEIVEGGMQKATMAVAYLGDVIRGLEVAWAVVDVGFKAFAAGLFNTLDLMQENIVAVLNLMPGINLEPIETLSAITREANAEFQKTKDVLSVLVSQPMPSETIEAFFQVIEEKAGVAAEEVAKVVEKMQAPAVETDDVEFEQDAKLESLLKLYEGEALLLEDKYANEQLLIDEAYILDEISTEKHEQVMTAISVKYAKQRKRLDDIETKNRVSNVQGMFGNLTLLMESGNKEMFEIGKSAAIANTIMSTYSSAQKSYDAMADIPYVGPILGGIAAAAAIAVGIQRVNAIQSTSFGSKSVNASGGGAPVNGTPVLNTIPPPPSEPEETKSNETIIIQGIDPDKLYSGQQLRDLSERIAESDATGVSFV